MTVSTIGRKALLKHSAISVVVILLLITITVFVAGQGTDRPITLGRILKTFTDEFLENLSFICVQVIIILVTIWYVGGLCGQWIIVKGMNVFLAGGLSILALWISLLIGSTLTAGVINSIQYAEDGFKSALVGWMVYGLLPFMTFGLIHGLLIGFPLGREIRKCGEKLNALQQNV